MKYLLPSGLAVAAIALSFASCIRDEALNAECDITGVDSAWVAGIRQQGIIKGEPIVTNESVRFIKRRGDVDCSALAPLFTLTPGATIEPANGSVRDFTTPQTYTVTAEDGNWRKVYTVEFGVLEASSKYGFDHAKLDASRQYQEFYELQGNLAKPDTARIWASGNGGYAFTGMAKSPGEYPTTISPDGRTGSCARLETMDTGSFGAGLNMHIAAGNLFIGEFRTASAVLYPRRATRFGLLRGRPRQFRSPQRRRRAQQRAHRVPRPHRQPRRAAGVDLLRRTLQALQRQGVRLRAPRNRRLCHRHRAHVEPAGGLLPRKYRQRSVCRRPRAGLRGRLIS